MWPHSTTLFIGTIHYDQLERCKESQLTHVRVLYYWCRVHDSMKYDNIVARHFPLPSRLSVFPTRSYTSHRCIDLSKEGQNSPYFFFCNINLVPISNKTSIDFETLVTYVKFSMISLCFIVRFDIRTFVHPPCTPTCWGHRNGRMSPSTRDYMSYNQRMRETI